MTSTLKAALPIVAKMLSDRLNVEVRIGGPDASTDGKVINLPTLPLESIKAEMLAIGFLVHEVGHVRYTTFEPYTQNPVLHNMVNILEDVRIEGCMRKQFLGATKSLKDLIQVLHADGALQGPAPDAHPIDLFFGYIFARLNCDVLGQSVLANIANDYETRLRDAIPDSTFRAVQTLMFEVTSCKSTTDIIGLASRILALVEEDSQDQAPPAPQSQSESSSDDEGGESGNQDEGSDEASDTDGSDQNQQNEQAPSSDSGNSPNQDLNDDAGDKGAQSSADDKGDSEAKSKPDDGAQSDATGGAKAHRPGSNATNDSSSQQNATGVDEKGQKLQKQNLKSILNAKSSSSKTDVGAMAAAALNQVGSVNDDGTHCTVAMSESEVGAGLFDPAELLMDTRSSTNALRFRMEHLLETMRRCKRQYADSGRRIVPNRMWKLRAGNTKVFERQYDGVEINTGVMVLLDRSRSMNDQLSLACQATMSLMLSLAHVEGLKSAAAAFPAPDSSSSAFNEQGRGVTVLTDFGERVNGTASRYASLGAYGGTPMAEALLWSVYKLLSEKVDRRILFVATDGQPKDAEATRKVLLMAERAGIEVIGLGIGLDISKVIKESRAIRVIDEMPAAVFQMLESKLMFPMAA